MTIGDTGTIHDGTDDDTVLHQLRQACAERVEHPESGHDDTQLYALRDQALSRGLPLPSSCPMGPR